MTRSSRAVFLSYASEDAAAAQRICAALQAAGVEVWFDQNELRGGETWDRHIRKQIHECGLFIAIVSAHSDAREEGYFRREWWLAVERLHDLAGDTPFLLPVAIDDTVEARARVPDQFRDVQWLRLPPGDLPASIAGRVIRLLNPAQSPADHGNVTDRAGLAVSASPPSLRSATKAAARNKHWALIALAAVVLIAAAYFANKKVPRPAVTTSNGAAATAPLRSTAAPPIPEKSIAVLPFVDMSEKKDQEYFSDGLTEELIDHLAHAPKLRVTSRTSSFQFKGTAEDLRSIAGKLGVAHILEGSVRKSGKELRITAQLIRTADDTHLWSQTYDRDLKDIFKLQDEIATIVSHALQVALSPSARTGSEETTNTEAYSLVLKGNYYFARGSGGDDAAAISQYQQALQLQPDYARAWAMLARTYVWQSFADELPASEGAAKARQAALKALAIDPNSVQAHYALGNVYFFYDYDRKAARTEFERVLALDAYGETSAEARENISELAASETGNYGQTTALYLEHITRNPLDTNALTALASSQQFDGQLEESAATSRRLLDINPRFATGPAQYAVTLLLMGRAADALATAQREPNDAFRLMALACAHWSLGHKPESTAAVGRLEASHGATMAYLTALAHGWRGERDTAFTWLDRAYRQRETALVFVKHDPMFRSLHGDPRFHALLVKMKLAD